ncbi:hypothetical protein [Marinicella meishanensis]|uniref:hypothetical protein n=1 Tax=Marinicella meishanensis TaxID=2873263 RepID=UPI001CBF7DAB|nr:hypothetical protein [Marinicella sp. NBU2979]
MSQNNEITNVLSKLESVKTFQIPQKAIKLSADISWMPDGKCKINGKKTLVCIHSVNDELPIFLMKRIEAAVNAGIQILIVSGYKILKNQNQLSKLVELNVLVSFIGINIESIEKPEFIATAISKSKIKVSRQLLSHTLTLSREAVKVAEKGKRFEQFLCLFFSQIEDFFIISSNYRTKTEEIDIVIQIKESNSSRCWARFEAPYILVEAKNQVEKVGQGIISKQLGIMIGKAIATKLGISVSMNGFTTNAINQTFRNNDSKKKVILITAKEIEHWILQNKPLDDQLEAHVSKSLLE